MNDKYVEALKAQEDAAYALAKQGVIVRWLEEFIERAHKDKRRVGPLPEVYGMMTPELLAEKRKLAKCFITARVTLRDLDDLRANEGMGM